MKRRDKQLNNRASMFRKILLASVIPLVFAVAFMALTIVPMLHSSASMNDEAYEEQLLLTTSNYLERLELTGRGAELQLESTQWLHELFISHCIYGKPIQAKEVNEIVSVMMQLAAKEPTLRHVAMRYDWVPDELYTSAGAFTNLEFYLEQFPDTLTYRFFPLNGESEGFISVQVGGVDYLLYRLPLQDVAGGQTHAQMNLFFDTDHVIRDLDALTDGSVSQFRICDRDGRVLWSGDVEREARVYTTSVDFGRHYRLELDISGVVHAKTQRQVMVLALSALLIALIVSLGFGVYLARVSYRPVENVARKYTDGEVPLGAELDTLSRVLDRNIQDRKDAEDILTSLRPLARQSIVGSFLDGSFLLRGSYGAPYCNLEFQYSRFVVVACRLPFSKTSGDDLSYLRSAERALETVSRQMGEGMDLAPFTYYGTSDQYYLLVNYKSQVVLEDYLSRLYNDCRLYFESTDYAMDVRFAVGSSVGNPGEIYRSKDEAERAENYGALNGSGGIIRYGDIEEFAAPDYYYPFSEETLLSKAILGGDRESALFVLDQVIRKNVENGTQTALANRQLYSDLYSTVARSLKSLSMKLPAQPDISSEIVTLEVVRNHILELIQWGCAQIESRKQTADNSMEEAILRYIDEHILDAELSLKGLSERFNRSTAYISILFKERRGVNYSEYVNSTRIMRAVELINAGESDLEKISETVGFSSFSTFRRNFLKCTGRSPGEYRDTSQ